LSATLAVFAGTGGIGSIGAGEAETRDDGEHGARFDQCFHGVFCVVLKRGNHSPSTM
jgi:hypothetical protein